MNKFKFLYGAVVKRLGSVLAQGKQKKKIKGLKGNKHKYFKVTIHLLVYYLDFKLGNLSSQLLWFILVPGTQEVSKNFHGSWLPFRVKSKLRPLVIRILLYLVPPYDSKLIPTSSSYLH